MELVKGREMCYSVLWLAITNYKGIIQGNGLTVKKNLRNSDHFILRSRQISLRIQAAKGIGACGLF